MSDLTRDVADWLLSVIIRLGKQGNMRGLPQGETTFFETCRSWGWVITERDGTYTITEKGMEALRNG